MVVVVVGVGVGGGEGDARRADDVESVSVSLALIALCRARRLSDRRPVTSRHHASPHGANPAPRKMSNSQHAQRTSRGVCRASRDWVVSSGTVVVGAIFRQR